MITSRKILIAGAVCVGALGLAGSRLAAPAQAASLAMPQSRRPAASPDGVCRARQLNVTMHGGGVGLGHVGIELRLHNISGQRCTLTGYPSAFLLDARLLPMPTTVHQGSGYLSGNRPVRRVTLTPGGDAYAMVEWTHVPSPGQSCPVARNLLFLPPGADGAQLIAMGRGGIDACGGQLTVSPVEPTSFNS